VPTTSIAPDQAILRQATGADIPAMSAIRLAVTENVLSNPARITPQMYEDYLEKLGRGWVAEIDGRITGFAYADRTDATIWALFVAPGYEGRGLARALLALATQWLFGLGAGEITLSTAADTRADRFYAAQGWARTGMKNAIEVGYSLSAQARETPA
jgi:GNAT superfamily N-acetyltransferase